MSTSRIFHSFHLDIYTSEANRIYYIILPERLKESEKPWLDRMAEPISANMVIISGMEWMSEKRPYAEKEKEWNTLGKDGWEQVSFDPTAMDIKGSVEESMSGFVYGDTEVKFACLTAVFKRVK